MALWTRGKARLHRTTLFLQRPLHSQGALILRDLLKLLSVFAIATALTLAIPIPLSCWASGMSWFLLIPVRWWRWGWLIPRWLSLEMSIVIAWLTINRSGTTPPTIACHHCCDCLCFVVIVVSIGWCLVMCCWSTRVARWCFLRGVQFSFLCGLSLWEANARKHAHLLFTVCSCTGSRFSRDFRGSPRLWMLTMAMVGMVIMIIIVILVNIMIMVLRLPFAWGRGARWSNIPCNVRWVLRSATVQVVLTSRSLGCKLLHVIRREGGGGGGVRQSIWGVKICVYLFSIKRIKKWLR